MRADNAAPWGGKLALIIAAGCTAGLHVGKVPVSLPALREAFGLDLFEASFILSMLVIAAMLVGVFGGMLADRFGQRRSMLCGLLLAAVAGLFGALAQSPTQLFVSRAVESVAFIATILPGPAMIARVVPTGRLRTALGLWSGYMPAGMSLALVLSPVVLAHLGWRALWVGTSLICIALAVWIWRAIPPDDRPAGGLAGGEALLAPVRATLSAAGPWLLAAGFACYAAQWISLFGFLPSLYADEGVGFGVAGSLTALGVAINMIGTTGGGMLAQRGVRLARVYAFASAAMLVAIWVIFASGWPFAARYAAVMLFSAAGGLIPGSLFVATPVMAPNPHTVSTTTGLMQQGSASGQFLMPPLVAMVVSATGAWSAAWWLLGSLALLNIGIGVAIGRRFDARLKALQQRPGVGR